MIHRSLASFAGLLFVALVAFAQTQTPAAPIMLTAHQSGGASSYGLANAIAGAPFSISTPTAPTITSEATVNNATLEANKVNGRRLILQADTYGDETFSTLNQEIIQQPGANIGTLTLSGDLIEVRGETANAGDIDRLIVTGTASDIYVRECTITDGAGIDDFNHIQSGAVRVAITECNVTASSYAFYVDILGTADIIIANNDIHSTGADGDPTLRFMSVNRGITRHNCLSNGGAAQVHRIHANTGEGNSANHWVEDNQLEGPPGQIQPDSTGGGSTATLSDIWYRNNDIYSGDGANWGNMGSAGQRATNLNMNTNHLRSTGGVFPDDALEVSWDISGNTVSATATAPACTIGSRV